MKENLFRKKALVRHSNTDNLDQLVVQPSLPYWIILTGFLIIVIGLYLSFIHLTIYDFIDANGIFITNNSENDTPLSDLHVLLFVQYIQGPKIKPGLKVQISPLTLDKGEYAYIRGTVTTIGQWPASRNDVVYMLNNNSELADYLLRYIDGPPYIVEVLLDKQEDDPNSFIIVGDDPGNVSVQPATPCHGRIILNQKSVQENFF
ncbi:hypothetical protein [Methanospirillum hungatei]|uniref:hypothetical protein n=1 Tax=Methanospirillum hungatei TaxID=2203 RepID=UPI0026EDD80E|nr:hypothetical protein [Methanospirillum hungatei]MCA1916239.1 hypothetical protein [Methanospirillum hungatei]